MHSHLIPAAILLAVVPAVSTAQVLAGPEFQANTYTTGLQTYPRVGMSAVGDFVVVWPSRDGQDGSQAGVFGQRFSAGGQPRGDEFQVNTYTTFYQDAPAVAVGPRGTFVVVWVSEHQDGLADSIRGQRYDAGGAAIGGEFLVNSMTTEMSSGPRVGVATDGRFVVVWGYAGARPAFMARRFDASGNPFGTEFTVNTSTNGLYESDLAVADDGSFVVTWSAYDVPPFGTAIKAQRFDAAGNRLGTEFRVDTVTFGAQHFPSVSVSPAGGFVIAWTRPEDFMERDIVARIFDPSGAPPAPEFRVNSYRPGNQVSSDVAHDALGNFTVTWTSTDFNGMPGSFHYSASMAQRFTADGIRRGSEFFVDAHTTRWNAHPAVASDAAGNLVVTWDTGSDVLVRRTGGLAPTALEVDASGNGVLEPGETVEVSPAWRNRNGSAQTFAATLSAIAGPPGATYAITDGAGDYGTVADGVVAPCTDCYAVSVSDPAVRPALHWDASAVEGIVPDAQGQQQRWRLHVGRSFADVAGASPFYRFVETLLHRGVTGGCGPAAFCPASSTTREQMAVFVLAAKEGEGYAPPPCTTAMFGDVPPASPFCPWIEDLARRGVVAGCGSGSYCPASAVSREQMAVFVLPTLDPALSPPKCVTGAEMFADVSSSSLFCRWIEELARRGVVAGCGGGNYCPLSPVTREQMGVFLVGTFGLALYGL